MQFIKHELGPLEGGEIAEISITSPANVRLLDSDNFWLYRSGRRHKYIGGHYKESPVRLEIPDAGHWFVTVDLGGYEGRVGSDFRILLDEPSSQAPMPFS